MRATRASELLTGETLRCGRCADILPDETLTFCKSCGVPFSSVLPTTSYQLLTDERQRRQRSRYQLKLYLSAFMLFTLFWSAYGLIGVVQGEQKIKELRPKLREVQVFIKDFSEVPSLDSNTKRDAVLVAQKSFQDHFGLPLHDVSQHEGTWPPLLRELFDEVQNQLQTVSPSDIQAIANLPATKLSFWEKKIFPALTLYWKRNPSQPLQVVITNLPIFVDRGQPSSVETRHLSGSGLVSGLGHPGLVLISTFRLHNEVESFAADRPLAQSSQEKARFLGEYVIAHELGHALLGLSDVVTPLESYSLAPLAQNSESNTKKTSAQNSRKPAAIAQESVKESPIRHCLMHTDQGGGFRAWEYLKKRELGSASSCSGYDNATQAFALRLQAIGLLKGGQRDEAEKAHREAIQRAKTFTQDWVVNEWTREHQLFLSVFSRWWRGIFVFQSSNDQL